MSRTLLISLAAALAALSLSGCALEPTHVAAYAEHVSHVTQHFQAQPTNFGYQSINVSARWQSTRGPFLELSEGYNFTRAWKGYGKVCGAGALEGPAEVFTARAGWQWNLKP